MSTAVLKLYALSTCIHCRRTVEFLNENAIPYDLTYVDKAEGAEREAVIEEVKKYNPRISFPTMVSTKDQSVIVGFQPEAIMEKFGNA